MECEKLIIINYNHRSNLFSNSGVVWSGENSEPKYVNFLCFVVSVQTNKLMSRRGGIGYSRLQMETHNLIKSIYANGMGYRRIANYLN